MTVAAIIKHRLNTVFTVREDDDFLNISAKLTENKVGVLVVVDRNGEMLGIVSERDLVTAAARKKSDVFSCTAREMMTKKVYVCSPDDTDTQIMAYMVTKGIRHLPVIDDGKVVGMMSLGDAVRSRLIKRKVLHEEMESSAADERRGAFSKHLRVNVEPKVSGKGSD